MFVATLVTFMGVTLIVRPPILTGETLDTELMVNWIILTYYYHRQKIANLNQKRLTLVKTVHFR